MYSTLYGQKNSNSLATNRRITLKFCSDIYHPQSMNHTGLGDSQGFPLATHEVDICGCPRDKKD